MQAPQWSDPMQWGQLASKDNSLLRDKYVPSPMTKYLWLTFFATSTFCSRNLGGRIYLPRARACSAQAVQVNLNFLISATKYLKCMHMAMMTSCSNSYLSFSPLLLALSFISREEEEGRQQVPITPEHGHSTLYSGLGIIPISGVWPTEEESLCFMLYHMIWPSLLICCPRHLPALPKSRTRLEE